MELDFTQHAVERFIQRHAPGLSIAEARAHLEDRGHDATRLKQKTIKGQAQWQIDDPPCILVVKYDTRIRRAVVVTVLAEPETIDGIPPDEQAILDEWLEDNRDRLRAEEEKIEQINERIERPKARLSSGQLTALEQQRLSVQGKLDRLKVMLEREWVALQREQAALEARLVGQSSASTTKYLQQQNTKLVGALRQCIRFLQTQSGAPAEDLLDNIDPQYKVQAFLEPHTMTRQERREQMREVQQEVEEPEIVRVKQQG